MSVFYMFISKRRKQMHIAVLENVAECIISFQKKTKLSLVFGSA